MKPVNLRWMTWGLLLWAALGVGCGGEPPAVPEAPPDAAPPVGAVSTCMGCHNGEADYAGEGLKNPHPFGGPGSNNIECTTCHGGDPAGAGKVGSHVPPPPLFGTPENPRQKLFTDPEAEFNRRTLAGIDKIEDYTIGEKTYTALQYLQFINPGDLRVVSKNQGCGACHGAGQQGEWFHHSPIGQSSGFFGGTRFAIGVDNAVAENRLLYQDTAADYGFRAVIDEGFEYVAEVIGPVGKLIEFPEKAGYGKTGGIFENPAYNANALADYQVTVPGQGGDHVNQVMNGSPLEDLIMEQVAITCGDCHAGSAGANNRFADFRSSGCTSCHMEYSLDGRSRSGDPNVNRNEPANPDAIAAGERAHIKDHQIRNIARDVPGHGPVSGIADTACVGCHQGSNRTVLQFWGIRLDQNKDLVNNFQYPANPNSFITAANDPRLFSAAAENNTFNGRDAEQLIAFEDYDGDGLDDTPADVHHEAGMVCIDCHGGRDLHGGTANPAEGDTRSGKIISRMDQGVGIQCESCHGTIDESALYKPCKTDLGESAECAQDLWGNPLGNVTRNAQGKFWLRSRGTGDMHLVPQIRDVVHDNNVTDEGGAPIYNPKAAFAMGRVGDGVDQGPIQNDPLKKPTNGFTHTDNLDCASCHSSWTNNCVGCHLATEYDANPQNFFFSNITGERIVLKEAAADFTYITPVPFQLAVNTRGKITQTQPNTKMFYRYTDLNGDESEVFTFNDRHGLGNDPDATGAPPALSHNAILAHSIRGKISGNNEGPRYCVACHLTEDGLANHNANFTQFRNAIANNNYGNLNFNVLAQHIGQNTGNQLNSPLWVHMVAGLGSGLFLFDENGCPVNRLDANADRQFCNNQAPKNRFNANNVVYDLDRMIANAQNGAENTSNKHPMLDGEASDLRTGSENQRMAGPLGRNLVRRLADPDYAQAIILDRYYDADGQEQNVD